MRKFKNRLSALLLVVVLAFSGSVCIADNTDAVNESGFIPMTAQEYDALKEMGLLTDDILNMSANEMVTRAEFVGALYKVAGFSEMKMENPFTDVDSQSPYSDAISFFYQTGVVNGTSATTFSPNNEITCRQAVTIMVKFLGYKVSNSVGSYSDSAYMEAAYKYGLLNGVRAQSFDDALTAQAVVVLLYNCATADLVEVLSYSGSGEATNYINKDACILSQYHSIYYGKGTIDVSVNGQLYFEEEISINGTMYRTEGRDFSDYLGYKVRFFYKQDGTDRVLLWVNPEAINGVLTISSSELLPNNSEYNYDKIVYKNKAGKKTTAKINSYADIIYNYTLCNNASLDMIKPEVGSITLVDNNGDYLYDTVIVREYENLFVYATSMDENFIADRYGAPVFLDDYDYVQIIKDGEKIELNQINNNCVVSYLASPDKKYLYVYVNSPGVKESLVSLANRSGECVCGFESGEYTVSGTLTDLMDEGNYDIPELKPGKTYWYYLDITGRIAAIVEAADDAEQYALLVEIKEYSEFGSKDCAALELVLKDGTHTFVKTAKKLKIGDAEDQKGTDLPFGEFGEVVKVSFNKDGELKEIDFAEALDESANPFGYDKTKFTLDYPETNEFYFRNYLFGNRYAIGADTICFAIFTNKDGTKEYDVLPMNAIASNATYTNIKIYDCNEYRDIGALCMNYNRRDSFNSGFILVDEVIYAKGTDGEFYPQIKGLVSGKEVSYTLTHEDVLSEVNLKRGDIVRCSTYLNEVYRVELICRLSDKNTALIDTTNLGSQSDSRVFGYLYSNNGNNIVLYNPDGWTYGGKLLVTRTTTALANLSISVYDHKTDTVYPGSAKDLYHTAAPQLDGSISLDENSKKVFLYRENTTVGQIIVAQY